MVSSLHSPPVLTRGSVSTAESFFPSTDQKLPQTLFEKEGVREDGQLQGVQKVKQEYRDTPRNGGVFPRPETKEYSTETYQVTREW